ncbi:MAG TPA: class I SAM-dependent methyltransferase [Streptosporangiaceae bacterium]
MTQPWDDSYTRPEPAPWDLGRPQPAFVRLADAGLLGGRVLDSGCGSGEQTLLAAEHGADVTGVDIAPTAIATARSKAAARAKAAGRELHASFQVADVLNLGQLDAVFDTVIDSGVFHVFDDADRPRYVASLASVLQAGGICYLMCFSDRQPGTWGPRRVTEQELRDAFAAGWTIDSITADTFDVNPIEGTTVVQAWLAVIRRT